MTPSCYPMKQVRFMYISKMWIDMTSFFVVACFNAELSAKVVATAFWRGEVENEFEELGCVISNSKQTLTMTGVVSD